MKFKLQIEMDNAAFDLIQRRYPRSAAIPPCSAARLLSAWMGLPAW